MRGLASSFLAIYLRDHHAAGCAGMRVARRAAGHRSHGSSTEALARVASEIEADLRSLEALMAHLGVEPSRAKDVLARFAERLSRMKLNGRVLRHSPLSDVEELETLVVGITGKEALWQSLRTAASVPEEELERLIARAREQKEIVDNCRRAAARRAFASSKSSG